MLEISRNDIPVDYIVDYDLETRFIKLPIDKYLDLLRGPKEDQTNDPQRALINAVNNPKYRFICAAFARRLGKTWISNVIGQLVTLVPGSNVLIISPNYNLSTISFDLQRAFIKHFDLEVIRDNLKDRILELSNGSTIRMGSISQVDSCVGRSYDLILFDEAALSKDGQDAFNIALRPTLDKPGSKAIFISTPRGKKNWFSSFYHRGFSDDFPEWISMHADYTENARMSEDDVREAKNTMSKAEFEQEYMASFVSYEGQIYTLDGTNILHYDIEIGPKWEVFAGLDPGYRDPTAFIVIAFDPSEEIYYILDNYQLAEQTTAQHAVSIQELIDKWKVETIFIDSAAAQFSQDLAYMYDIACTRAKKDVLPGIAHCQSLIENGRVKVHASCIETLDSFDQYQWDIEANTIRERPLHNNASHLMDAMRYALYTFIV